MTSWAELGWQARQAELADQFEMGGIRHIQLQQAHGAIGNEKPVSISGQRSEFLVGLGLVYGLKYGQLEVTAWTLPDVKDHASLINIYQSPETLAEFYQVKPWSEAHWKLIDRSMRLLADIGNIGLFIPLLAESQMGNPESMVIWIRQPDGSYKYDFTFFDRYLDTALKYHDRLRFIATTDRARAEEIAMPTTLINLIIQIVAGAIGGNAAGAALKDVSLGATGNTIAGAIGGGVGGQILTALLPMLANAPAALPLSAKSRADITIAHPIIRSHRTTFPLQRITKRR